MTARHILRSLVALCLLAPWTVLLLVPSAPGARAAEGSCTADAVTVEADATAELGGAVRVRGTGWCHPTDGGSAIAVKLDDGAYSRVDDEVHANLTIWAIIEADPQTGDFDTTITLPDGTTGTSTPAFTAAEHTLRFLSGSLKQGDEVRTRSAKVAVGVPATEPPTEPPTGDSCNATAVTVEADATAELGGALRVRGTGWCHPTAGASVVAVKIDEGAYSHLNDALHANRTIWAIINPDPTTGDFDTTITLPDGTAATSDPVFTSGAHTLRFLTGSLKDGDEIRTRLSGEFVVGAYRPNGAPEPLDPDALGKGARGGVKAKPAKKKITVTVPGAVAGDWVYVDVYVDGAPRAPWGPTWFQTNAQGKVVLPLKDVTLPEGKNKLTVQSGNQGEVGRLRGWAKLKVAAAPTTSSSGSTATASTRVAAPASYSGSAAAAAAPPPAAAPNLPVEGIGQLTSDNAGKVAGVLEAGMLRVTVPGAAADDWLHVTLYDAQGQTALGWTRPDATGGFSVDVSALGDAKFKLAVQDEAGKLIGWTGGGVDGPPVLSPVADPAPATDGPAAAPVAAVDTPAPLLLNLGLSGIGLVSLVGTITALALGRKPATGKD